jgi:hypothetical protein
MGHGIDSRTVSRSSGCRSGWHSPATAHCTQPAGTPRWTEPYNWKLYDGRARRSEARAALEETACGTGQAGSA